MALRFMVLALAVVGSALCVQPATAQDAAPSVSALPTPDEQQLIGEVLGFYGTQAIVGTMTGFCYDNAGYDEAYRLAGENWYLRNVGFLDLATRVIDHFGGVAPGQRAAAEQYGAEQIMAAFEASPDKLAYCENFRTNVDEGAFDIDRQLPEVLARARAVTLQ